MRSTQPIRCLLLCLYCLPAVITNSQVKLPRLISDNMILQRNAPIVIWGWASPNETIHVQFTGKTYTTSAKADSGWRLVLPAMPAGGPYSMQINQRVIKNILLGDVWVCSGQSNMELPMERVKEKYTAAVANATNPFIRQFGAPTTYNFKSPQADLVSGSWQEASPTSILQFTAVGYFFAKSLYDQYKIPIGLIKCAVGGSPAEAWLPEQALHAFPNYYQTLLRYRNDAYVDSIRTTDKQLRENWYAGIAQRDKGLQENKPWFDTAYDAHDWSTMPVPSYWDDHGLKGVNGVVWFRKEIQVPASMTGKPATLLLGRIVDQDSVYVNGRFAGTIGYQYPPRRYQLPVGMLKAGKNTIVVRVINSANRGGFITDKPYQLITATDTISLNGDWQYKLGAAVAPLPPATNIHYQPSGLFNAMLSPLLPYRIKGVIWYQGESNTTRPAEYDALLPAVINNWRQQWKQGDFPFIYVQLANFLPLTDQPTESNWARVREAQRKTLQLPNTGMAVITDIGEWNDVHPLNKEDVGKRLSLWAQRLAYNDNKIVYAGPLYKDMQVQGNTIIIRFTNVGSGLLVKGSPELHHFAIAGADKQFVWATATIKGNTVIVHSEQVPHPVAVRYGWSDNPVQANLYNKEGLPASSFKTDEW